MSQLAFVESIVVPPAPAEPRPTTLFIVTHPNRGSPYFDVRDAAEVEERGFVQRGSSEPHVLAFDLAPGRTFDHAVRLPLHAHGEPTEVVRYVFASASSTGSVIVVADGDACPSSATTFTYSNSPLPPSAAAWTVEDYGSELDSEIKKALQARPNDKLVRARRFFASFDQGTSPTLGQIDPSLVSDVNLIQTLALDRVRRRGAWCRDHPQLVYDLPADPISPAVDGALRRLSSLQLGAFERSFTKNASAKRSTKKASKKHKKPKAMAQFDSAAFGVAFERFANGELICELPICGARTTQPSSANFFLFAEFAFFAHDYGIDTTRWERIANALTRAQRIYRTAYAPRTSGRHDFGDWKPCNFGLGDQCVDEPGKAQIRTDFEAKTMKQLRTMASWEALTAMPAFFDGYP